MSALIQYTKNGEGLVKRLCDGCLGQMFPYTKGEFWPSLPVGASVVDVFDMDSKESSVAGRAVLIIHNNAGNRLATARGVETIWSVWPVRPDPMPEVMGLCEGRDWPVEVQQSLTLDRIPTSLGAVLIAQKRQQQIDRGYTSEADQQYASGELIWAAYSFLYAARELPGTARDWWPLGWTYRDSPPVMGEAPIDCLVHAGALIAAEIDRRKLLI